MTQARTRQRQNQTKVVLSEFSFFRKGSGFEMSGNFSRLKRLRYGAETFFIGGDDSLSGRARTHPAHCDCLTSLKAKQTSNVAIRRLYRLIRGLSRKNTSLSGRGSLARIAITLVIEVAQVVHRSDALLDHVPRHEAAGLLGIEADDLVSPFLRSRNSTSTTRACRRARRTALKYSFEANSAGRRHPGPQDPP